LTRSNVVKRACGLGITIAVLDLYSYYLRELLVSLVLFTGVFLILALATFAAVFLWWASEQLLDRTGPASRKVIGFLSPRYRGLRKTLSNNPFPFSEYLK
jgi:hypothetical protein